MKIDSHVCFWFLILSIYYYMLCVKSLTYLICFKYKLILLMGLIKYFFHIENLRIIFQ